MRFAYRDPKPMWKATRALLNQVLAVLAEYKKQGYVLTLRQLHYQLVAANVYKNTKLNYARLGRLLGEARMCGLCDWDVIEDRIRQPRIHNEWQNVHDALETLIEVFRRKRWADQPNYVEVWCEKDALSGVLLPITEDYHMRLMVNRGYSSISAMHDASIRFRDAAEEGKKCYLIYLGDLDPSGEDMARDIQDRLAELLADVTFMKIALTHDQVKRYHLPPNFAKLTDTRAKGFIKEHGANSWEADALPPAVLNRLLSATLEMLLDRAAYDHWLKIDGDDKERMTEYAEQEQAREDEE